MYISLIYENWYPRNHSTVINLTMLNSDITVILIGTHDIGVMHVCAVYKTPFSEV